MEIRGFELTERTKKELMHSGAIYRPDLRIWKIKNEQWWHLTDLAKEEVRHQNCMEQAQDDIIEAQTILAKQESILKVLRKEITESTQYPAAPMRITKTPKPVKISEIIEFKVKRQKQLDQKTETASIAAKLLADMLQQKGDQ